ncbi:hypothetical protein B0H65DRAFT_560129 [Neurospora tetraspora]|uniref:Kelch repeat protein n=1 Tax=Neurospora tetraspora TaxID=94610 RepID=A0AAE0J7X0_9PEZI|nr:hypothetical protein B0H65DRAFT_560129 [Neurospora tetraspora]
MLSATLVLSRGNLQVFYLTLLFIILVLHSPVHAQTLDSPTPENFIRRAHNRDISKSWTTSSVKIRTIPRKGPVALNTEAIWIDSTGNSFYIYGGVTSYNRNEKDISKKGIWKFTADGQGGGSWSLEEPANPDTFTSLRYTTNSAYASSAGIGFSIGGYQAGDTDPDIPGGGDNGRWQTSGMVSYNMMTKEWQNHTSIGMLGPKQSLEDGRAIHVPGFGPDALVFVLGGSAKAAAADPKASSQGPLVSFANVSFFDPSSKQWYWQTTTGEAPKGRVGHCLVGSLSQEGSFEIFVYGGSTQSYDSSLDDLYVLSLPGFQWFRADDRSDTPRARGACVVVGKRQMLAIGGVDFSKGPPNSKYWQDQDPLPQGLGLFDMTAMRWVRNGSYDADAEAYQSPQVVQDWYRAGNLPAVPWSSNVVKGMFSSANVTFPTDGPVAIGKPTSKINKTGLVAGCVAAGCVVVAIFAAVFLYRRRRTRETKPSPSPNQKDEGFVQAEEPKELPVQPPAVEAYVPPVELAEGNHYWELPEGEHHKATPRVELDA